MTLGYKISLDDDMTPFTVAPNYDSVDQGKAERDLSFVTDGGQKTAYKLSSRRFWDYSFTLIGWDEHDFFESLHKASRGRIKAFYFFPDIADEETYYIVRKEPEYRPIRHRTPVLVNGVATPVWDYVLRMVEEPPTILLGVARLEVYECPNGNGSIENSVNAVDADIASYCEMARSHFGVFATAKFTRIKIPFVELEDGQVLTITCDLEYTPGDDFAVEYKVDLSADEHDTSSDSGGNNFWTGPISGIIDAQPTGTAPWSGQKIFTFTGGSNPMPGDVYIYFWTGTSVYEPCFPSCGGGDSVTQTLRINQVDLALS